VCSGKNVERVRSLGADQVIDYETEDPLATDTPYDLVFDNAGGVRIKDWRRVVPRGGVILPNAGTRGPDGGALMRVAKAQWHRLVAPQRVMTFYASVSRAALEELGDHVAAGRVQPLVDTMFRLEHAAEALARVATHHARGKVIVTMGTQPRT
jgi:NADPH:quinone reductase-like Zn-dependent oxidoreductase